MSSLDEINQQVAAEATTTVAEITSDYNIGCKIMTETFMSLLTPMIFNMEAALGELDFGLIELDIAFGKFPAFPPFPKFPAFSFKLPGFGFGFSVEDLNCPLASCLGMPSLPKLSTLQFNAGPPPEPIEPVQSSYQLAPPQSGNDVPAFTAAHDQWVIDHAKWVEDCNMFAIDSAAYTNTLNEYVGQMNTAIGSLGEVGLKANLKVLNASPQALLNGVLDSIKAAIASLVNFTLLADLDGMVDCLVSKDARFGKTHEIIRYRKLRAKLASDSSGKPNIPLSGAVAGVLGPFIAQKNALTSKLSESRAMKSVGSGAKSLTSSNPLAKFKSPF